MTKYTKFQHKSPEKKGIHPIWRGIGCILMIVFPLLAYVLMIFLAPMIIATGKVPPQLLGHIHFPPWAFKVRIIAEAATYLGTLDNLWLNIIIFLVLVLLLSAVASLIYSLIYSLVGPEPYSEVDAPPGRYKPKEYKR